MKNRVTTNLKHTIDLKRPKRREHKYNTKENHQATKGKTKKKKKETKKKYKTNRKTRFKMAINRYLPIITLNVNGLNAPIKRHKVADWIKKKKPKICCLQETHFR